VAEFDARAVSWLANPFSESSTNNVSILRPSTAVKVSGNQGTSAPANIDLRCGSTYQITVGIERTQKARLIWVGIWLDLSQRAFVYEE
jgi:hypothetical protein